MPPKGKKRAGPPQPRPLSPTLARKRKRGSDDESPPSRWSWIRADVRALDQLSPKHLAWACGFAEESGYPVCANRWAKGAQDKEGMGSGKDGDAMLVDARGKGKGRESQDVIDLTASTPCDKKTCRDNPNCLNHLGAEAWEDQEEAQKAFLKVAKLGFDPRELNRDPQTPVGLRNLGATCYANAFIQVWFQDLAFRAGVYACQPSAPAEKKLEDAPLFQLQATFAALQQCQQNVYNPVKLVESLGLRTSEQQDATEFGKLFMNLLGEQFQLQDTPSVKTLLRDQFEGHLTYCTTCKGCGHTSERESTFLELELNLGVKSHLEERILELLKKEELTGDNKYACSQCNSLQNATRWVKLRECPPVLHFSLMRFVYDVKTYERKKSKQIIQAPLMINMRPFINAGGPLDDQIYELRGVLLHRGVSAYHGHYVAQAFDVTKGSWFEFNDEEVTAIDKLMDGKPVFPDAEGEKMQSLGKRKPTTYRKDSGSSKKSKSDPGSDSDESPVRKGKKKAVDVIEIPEDDEVDEADVEKSESIKDDLGQPRYIKSKDAYMLIYARREQKDIPPMPESSVPEESLISERAPEVDKPTPVIPSPPLAAVNEVERLNEEHDRKCEEYTKREQAVLESFAHIRAVKQELYGSWNIQGHDEDSIVVNAEDLRKWLAQGLDMPKPTQVKDPEIQIIDPMSPESAPVLEDQTNPEAAPLAPSAPGSSTSEARTPAEDSHTPTAGGHLGVEPDGEPSLSDADSARTLVSSPLPAGSASINTNWLQGTLSASALCEHGLIVPPATGLKRINTTAYVRLLSLGVHIEPAVAHTQICNVCTEQIVTEHVYITRHPEQVKLFHNLNSHPMVEDHCYWISKAWIRDWSSSRPKMHVYGQLDPAPDQPPWKDDVSCEHDGLKLSDKDRKGITEEAHRLLLSLYPDWETFKTSDETCPVCQELDDMSLDARQESRKAAEQEKLRLRSMYSSNPLANRPVSLIEGFSYAVVPSRFMRAWRVWINNPLTNPRPESLDTSIFFCPHDRLFFDPNEAVDMEDIDLVVIKENEWKILTELYSADKLVRLQPTIHFGEDDTVRNSVLCNHEVCHDCRRERKSIFEEAPVMIYFMDITDPLPIGDTTAAEQLRSPLEGKEDDIDIVSVNSRAGQNSSPIKSDSTLDMYGYGNGSQYEGGLRKSKRLRQTKQRGLKKSMTITKADSVKDIKMKIFDLFSVATIHQRLFHGGRELLDNTQTVADLGILAQDTISLLEVKPLEDDEDGDGRPTKKRRDEGGGFGGTLLSGGPVSSAPASAIPTSDDIPTPISTKPASTDSSYARAVAEALTVPAGPPSSKAESDHADFDEGIQCPACTFINPSGVSCCTMCENAFSGA